MTIPVLLFVAGLLLAAAAAAIGVAAAAVSQLQLTRWVSYKLRGAGGAAGVLENPGHLLATANALTTLGIIGAAAAIPALLARTTPTILGVFTVALGVPFLVSYLSHFMTLLPVAGRSRSWRTRHPASSSLARYSPPSCPGGTRPPAPRSRPS